MDNLICEHGGKILNKILKFKPSSKFKNNVLHTTRVQLILGM